MGSSKKTVQLGIRVDKKLIDRLSFFAKESSVDKMDLIRQAIAVHVAEMEKGFEEEVIEEYVGLRINEGELKKALKLDKISDDIKKARQENLNKIKKSSIMNKRLGGLNG